MKRKENILHSLFIKYIRYDWGIPGMFLDLLWFSLLEFSATFIKVSIPFTSSPQVRMVC